ncbi:carbohydrate ABC transporter permease [Eubacterium sp. am_0171]|uniref:Inner membrane ABC transporter permease protein ycjP n=1 Tax=Faecalicatena contorta TaxID=39482 RepID=A0A174D8S9_9FIRM|nr:MULTISPECIES: carbohydrate ABC transporter permease [Clostridia]MBS6765276.1 carbohydrate ABC transporter permease [Clostridium sp.]MDU7708602.1 carbohydrate ABC transporter permease [Clostridium sp.]MSC84158.1 ABC transporter permease subunit [Eubacterium sp. BIOML-A1]MSD06582.1 ABC transporter permease subunit [Eubacterium sp. BIOML-A2]RYT18862.1 carbohydrate ABC transporter permease [Eubacterium sp. am_0171]
MKQKRGRRAVIIYIILIIFILITLLPYLWLVLTSFKTKLDAFSIPPKIFFTATLDNYYQAFIERGMLSSLKNSLIVMIATVVIGMVIGLPSAFAFSRFKTRGDKLMLNYLLGTRFTPFVVLALPLYLIMSKFGMLDSYVGIIIAHISFNLPFIVWMMKGFFDAVPKEIDEAARVEGYSWFRVFVSIDIPLAKSGLAATSVFCAINSWNEFLMALILTGRGTATMPVAIPGMMTPQGTLWGQIAAVGTVITIPVLIFAIMVQKHMVAGMTMGAVK